MWGLAQLSPQADVDLLQEVLQASEGWSEVSTASLSVSSDSVIVVALVFFNALVLMTMLRHILGVS